MLPPLYATKPVRAVVTLVAVAAAAVVCAHVASARSSALTVVRVQPLPNGKPLESGRVNVVPVRPMFGFAVAVRNDSVARRSLLVKVVVSYNRRGQSPLVLKRTVSVRPGTARVGVGRDSGIEVAFAQRARLTVRVTDRARHTTATKHYAVIFALG